MNSFLGYVSTSLTSTQSIKLYADREYAYLDQKVESEVEKAFDVTWFHAQLLTNPDDLPFSVTATPHIFTKFRGKIEKYVTIETSAEEAQWSRLPQQETALSASLQEYTKGLALMMPRIHCQKTIDRHLTSVEERRPPSHASRTTYGIQSM